MHDTYVFIYFEQGFIASEYTKRKMHLVFGRFFGVVMFPVVHRIPINYIDACM